MKIQKTNDEFMLLPTFSIDNWYTPKLNMTRRVYTIGWLKWFIRCANNKVGFDFKTRGYESNF